MLGGNLDRRPPRIARVWLRFLLLCPGPVAAAALLTSEPTVSFRRDVMQVLSKAGCNAGACHGNANGKGGFKLSLRSEDAEADYQALVQDQSGRRIHLLEPAQSLLLLKATTAVAHEGGLRFTNRSPAYRYLHDWIAGGALDDAGAAPAVARLEVSPGQSVVVDPADELRIRAVAHFADGSRREVSSEVVYETSNPYVQVSADGRVQRKDFGESVVLVRYLQHQEPVRVAFIPARAGFHRSGPRPAGFVDEQVFAKLHTLRLNPPGRIGDATFLRRASLDLLGRLPSRAEMDAFLRDAAEDKRSQWIDRRLQDPAFAENWALKWSDLLRVEERTLDRKGMTAFHGWIRDCFARNQPLDQFARDLITARGSTYMAPAANFYRANRTAIDRALTVSQVFLGTRLNCAQCHNHPFDRWSQNDYHDWAAVFARVNFKVLRNDRRDSNDSHEFKGEQIVFVAAQGELTNPRTGKPAVPRMLGMATPMDASDATNPTAIPGPDQGAGPGPATGVQRFDELESLARWLTSPTNTTFARVQANRIWSQLMGRGLVDPVDDFRATNPASHPELLEALGAELVRSGFDLRHLLRTIMISHTYQAAAVPGGGAGDADEINYTHIPPRRLSAELLLDAQHQVAGVPWVRDGYPGLTRAIQFPGGAPLKQRGVGPEDAFLQVFGKPKRLLTCECERSDATTMAQAFELISGPTLNRLVSRKDNVLAELLAADPSGRSAVDELFGRTLSRTPEPGEREAIHQRLAAATGPEDRRAVLEDLLWALLNSKEFLFRP